MLTIQRQLRVLVVDDNAEQANSLSLVLESSGYDSHVCLYAKDCMAAVEQLRPQVLLLDLTMPGMSGFDIAHELKRNPDLRPARLVAVTGHGQESVRQQTKTSDFDHHLLKPVDFHALEAILRTAERIRDFGVLPDSEIRLRAYAKWEAAGRPRSNSDDESSTFWYAAQRELIEERIRQDVEWKGLKAQDCLQGFVLTTRRAGDRPSDPLVFGTNHRGDLDHGGPLHSQAVLR